MERAERLSCSASQVMDKIEKKDHKLIGAILREEGFVTTAQINDVLITNCNQKGLSRSKDYRYLRRWKRPSGTLS